MPKTRVCTWCGETVPDYPESCPHCETRMEANLPDPATMTASERADEMERYDGILEVRFDVLHGRIEALARRPVFTHELANYHLVIRQAREERPPTAEEFCAPFDGKDVIIVEAE